MATLEEFIKKLLENGLVMTSEEILLAAKARNLPLGPRALGATLLNMEKGGEVRSKTVKVYWLPEKQQEDNQTSR